MSNKHIYFLIEGNEQLVGYLGDVTNVLNDSIGAKCQVFQKASELLRRLKKRKTRPAVLIFLMNNLGNGLVNELCAKVPSRALPEKAVFVNSSYSSLAEDELERKSEILERNGISVWRPLSLTDISRSKEISKMF